MSWLSDIGNNINNFNNKAKQVVERAAVDTVRSNPMGRLVFDTVKEGVKTYNNSPYAMMSSQQRKNAYGGDVKSSLGFNPKNPNVGGTYSPSTKHITVNVGGFQKGIFGLPVPYVNSPSQISKAYTHEGAHSLFDQKRANSPLVQGYTTVEDPQRKMSRITSRGVPAINREYIHDMPPEEVVAYNNFLSHSNVYKNGYDLPSELFAYTFTNPYFRKSMPDNVKKYYR